MRRLSVLSLTVLALLLAACGGSGSKSSTVSRSTGSTGASGLSAPKPQPDQVRSPSSSGGKSLGPATVKVSFTEKSFFGAKSQVTYFVARRGGRSALAQAKACVRGSLRKAPSAYCFAFASERAFRFSQVSPRPPAKMKRPCWIAYWGKPSGRRPIGSGSNGAAAPLHCPGATG
jgi:hypothetical protein